MHPWHWARKRRGVGVKMARLKLPREAAHHSLFSLRRISTVNPARQEQLQLLSPISLDLSSKEEMHVPPRVLDSWDEMKAGWQCQILARLGATDVPDSIERRYVRNQMTLRYYPYSVARYEQAQMLQQGVRESWCCPSSRPSEFAAFALQATLPFNHVRRGCCHISCTMGDTLREKKLKNLLLIYGVLLSGHPISSHDGHVIWTLLPFCILRTNYCMEMSPLFMTCLSKGTCYSSGWLRRCAAFKWLVTSNHNEPS